MGLLGASWKPVQMIMIMNMRGDEDDEDDNYHGSDLFNWYWCWWWWGRSMVVDRKMPAGAAIIHNNGSSSRMLEIDFCLKIFFPSLDYESKNCRQGKKPKEKGILLAIKY